MQNKGAIRLVAILLGIACLYQLSFSFVASRFENKAEAYAAQFPVEEQNDRAIHYLDSLKGQKIYLWNTYKEVKEKEINLGLDLKGGMNVMLELAEEDVVKALAANSQDPNFIAAISATNIAQKNSTSSYVDLFVKQFNTISGGQPLAVIFSNQMLRGKVSPTSSDSEVAAVLKGEVESAIANSYNVLRNRIDRFGVTQPNIQRVGSTGRILVELPGVKEPERVRKLLQGTASLEFWTTYNNTETGRIFEQINNIVRTYEKAHGVETAPAQEIATEAPAAEQPASELDNLIENIDQPQQDNTADIENWQRENPFFAKLHQLVDPQTRQYYDSPVVGQALSYDTATVNSYLKLEAVKAILPRDIRFMWSIKPSNDAETIYDLYAIKVSTSDGLAPLDGSQVEDATEHYSDKGSSAKVSLTMKPEGAKIWARLTADNVKKCIAITLDGYVYSAPRVNEAINGGQSEISGGFTIIEAKDLANVLKSGKMPAAARITQEAVVGPSLGAESIRSSMISFVLAFLLVIIYMLVFYRGAGFAAGIALICNLFFLFGILVSFGAVLTLPGIAGIVLTMGMAVDANVLIYERIKEELRSGKGLSLAVSEGYKHAMSAIIDSNVTTILVGLVLFWFGTGPVQGFATTLIIGIITSLFTSIFITRLVFAGQLAKNKNIRFSTKWSENFLAHTKIDFIGKRKWGYIVSCILIIASVFSLTTRGLNFGTDFSGGRTFTVRFDQHVTADEIRTSLENVFATAPGDASQKSVEVKQYGADALNQMRITTQYMIDDQSEDATTQVENYLYKALEPMYKDRLTLEQFRSTATNPNGIISADMVGATVSRDITRNSFIAVFLALIAIFIYILVRFRNWQYSLGSVIGLAHDAFLTIGLFSIFYGVLPFALEIDQAFIAAILTIIGYSINDNVIIFDRVREFTRLYPKRTIRDNINGAINSTLARTINTSGTTLVTLLAIFFFGGEVIRGFVFALSFGVIIGTLSTLFVATPIAYDVMSKKQKQANG